MSDGLTPLQIFRSLRLRPPPRAPPARAARSQWRTICLARGLAVRGGQEGAGSPDSGLRGWELARTQVDLRDFKQAVRGLRSGVASREKALDGAAKALLAMLTSFPTSSSPLCFALHGSQENTPVCREAARPGHAVSETTSSQKSTSTHVWIIAKTRSLYIGFFVFRRFCEVTLSGKRKC